MFSKENLLFNSWAIAVLATGGSLFFSEILKYQPCNLCWYQRILMYPLVLLLGIMLIKKKYHHIFYVIPFTLIGMFFSLYHYGIQKFNLSNLSCGRVSCNEEYINIFNFITFPFLSFLSFSIILILSLVLSNKIRKEVKNK
ncbi:disulfide oxidoreductase [Priestia megaterium]|uniref:disulfide oxidoreductase n=1 Tax=Priestia TaxID=2800373 RepID=UPI001CF970F8|nr:MULTISPECIES: disulfide oxidoreductase [Priestia]MED4219522.1 disulfide oxidoreductase [Priestia megaterium]